MKTVSEILKKKGSSVWTIGPEEMVIEALRVMADKEIGALVVVESGKVVGIFTERDYARKVILKGAASRETPVRDIMSTRVAYAQLEMTAEECLALMTEKRFRHLPVIDDGELKGLVSIGDAVKAVIEEREFMIGQLENYIMGG
ncbi:MAG: CBS domain-containing protein [Desulfuromonadales bacterium]